MLTLPRKLVTNVLPIHTAAEVWKFIVGFENLYEVSNLGRVRNVEKQVLKVFVQKKQAHLTLYRDGVKKTFIISHLVAACFLEPGNGRQLRHWNDVETDNRVINLLWGTHQDNVRDMVRNGHSPRGEKNSHSKLTEEKVRQIKVRLHAGEDCPSIASDFGVSRWAVGLIKNGHTWGWVC